jgi:guanosine-3',5'-bis(diphosphate) 3'-pyrophosphohydrolase
MTSDPSQGVLPGTTTLRVGELLLDREIMDSSVADRLAERFAGSRRDRTGIESQVHTIRAAYALAYAAHSGQCRQSGEAYIEHPLAVAELLLGLHLDAASIAAALLHDVLEDTCITREQVVACFGEEIAHLVDGVTKLSQLEARTKEDVQAGSFRKMFLAIWRDPRVVLVKLADRLHNLRTIASKPPASQQRTARETLEIYAPLAHRLGIWQFKWELEDRAFAILNPDKYQEISRQLAMKRDFRERLIQRVMARLRTTLEREGIAADITGRPKHIYSIHRKMERKGVGLDQIYDQLAVRVIVGVPPEPATAEPAEPAEAGDASRRPARRQPRADHDGSRRREGERRREERGKDLCYRVLGLVHALWTPVPGEFDDYIARPKESMYQSLHTTVVIPGGQPCEVQIRTWHMHEVAELGIAAHWRYKEGFERDDPTFESKLAWLRGMVEWRRELTAREFVDSLRDDELHEQVYVFTPKGQIIDLPVGSSPVDFAYRIHSEVGNSCVGAKVNNRMVPLDHQLQSGEIVQIITTRTPRGPSRDWLNFVRTSGARNHIRRYFKRLHHDENVAAGREMLDKEMKRLGLHAPFEEIVRVAGLRSPEELFAQIGYGDIAARTIVQRMLAQRTPVDADDLAGLPPVAPPAPVPRTDAGGIQVRGEGQMLTRLARCCNPVVGEPIVGFVTRGRGVTVHRADCRTMINIQADDRGRLVEVTWGAATPHQGYPVPVRIEAWDRVGLWRDISGAVADDGINIDAVEQVQTRKPGRAVLVAILRVQSLAQLTAILDKLNRMRDVIEARRQQSSIGALSSG